MTLFFLQTYENTCPICALASYADTLGALQHVRSPRTFMLRKRVTKQKRSNVCKGGYIGAK